MRIYSRNNPDNLSDAFEIHLLYPSISKRNSDYNEWSDDGPCKVLDIQFNTQFLYKKMTDFYYFHLVLFGFGFSIRKQTGY